MSDVVSDPWFILTASIFIGVFGLVIVAKIVEFILWIVELVKWRLGHE